MSDEVVDLKFLQTFELREVRMIFGGIADQSSSTEETSFFLVLDTPEKWESQNSYKTLWILNSYFHEFKQKQLGDILYEIEAKAINELGYAAVDDVGHIMRPIVSEHFHKYVSELEIEIAWEIEKAKSPYYE